jgi:23S rRNA pseudouridine1911/1915/1917 synthase
LTIPDAPVPKRSLELNLEVLFEDEHLAAINKPPGILVSGNAFRTLAHALPNALLASSLPDAATPYPAHRLDFATTGVVLVGKTHSGIRMLNSMFEEKRIQKTYAAVAIGTMPAEGCIDVPIDDKPSQTNYKVLESVPSQRFGQLNLVKLHPKTGRMHQLRRHLAGIGNPVLGDPDYGTEPLILKGKGLYLHACSLRFPHPATQADMHLQAALPSKFFKIFPGTEQTPW